MTNEQLERAGKIKRELWELPKLEINGNDKTPTLLKRADAIKVLCLMFPTASSTDGYVIFSEADALNILGIIEAKRNQLQKEFDKL
jgi:hypothetical protein